LWPGRWCAAIPHGSRCDDIERFVSDKLARGRSLDSAGVTRATHEHGAVVPALTSREARPIAGGCPDYETVAVAVEA